MKRVHSETKLNYSLNVEIDDSVVLNPEKLAIFQKNESQIKLRDFIRLLGPNITRDELVYLHSQLTKELGKRTAIVCEMIPDDVWKRVFQLLAHKKDISQVFHLKQVCKRWERSFPSAIDEATILREKSLKNISDLKSIRSLIIKTGVEITERIFTDLFVNLNSLTLTNKTIDAADTPLMLSQMTNLKTLNLIQHDDDQTEYRGAFFINSQNLSLLVNLESLRIEEMSSDPFASLTKLFNLKYLDISALPFDARDLVQHLGANLEIIGRLKKLELMTLSGDFDNFPVKINELQRQYPHVRFRWIFENDNDTYYYEGSFCDDNLMSGKGVLVYLSDGTIYQGDFKDEEMHGKGVYNEPSYRYEGEYENDEKSGKGVLYWPDGDRYEGEFKGDNRHGSGVMFYHDRDRFEGEFENDGAKLGTLYYFNGNRYSGEFDDIYREGKGTLFFSNGNRYEGVYVKDERSGSGVFYYSNGEIVEGDETVFLLHEKDGTIEMVAHHQPLSSHS